MEVENAVSSEIPSSCHEKKKRRRQGVDKNVEANHDCPEGTSLGKDTSLEPPVKICTDVEAIMLEPPTNVTSEKKSKKKRRKTNDDVCKIAVSTKPEDTTLEPPVSVASEKKKKKKTSKASDGVLDNDSAFLDNCASVKPPVNISTLPTEVEATTLEPPASVTSERKKKKKKSKTSDFVVDNDSASLDNFASVKDIPREPSVDISTIPTEVEATTLEPQASVISEKKKKKKKSKTSDDFNMHAMDQESALVKDTLREPPVNTDNVAVFTNADAATSDPTSVTSEKRKKKKKRSKTSDGFKMNSIDHESASVEKSAAVKDAPLEPPINSCTIRIPTEAEEAKTLEPPANATSEKKKKKKKSKAVSDSKMDGLDHEGAPLENTASAEDTPVVPLVNLPMIAVPTEAEAATTLDPLSNVTSEKKKKKKRKAGSDSKLDAVDHKSTPLENTVSVENTPVAHSVNLPMIAVPTEAEVVTTSDTLTTLTSEKKKKKKKFKAGSDSKIDAVPTEETITSEPPSNLASEKKKKKRKSKRGDDSKMNVIDHKSALLEYGASAKNTPVVPLVNLSMIAVPTKAEEATTSEPQASEKKKKKKKSKTSNNSKMNAMDHESALLENSASPKDTPMMPLVDLSTTAADAEATFLEPPPNVASNKKKKKKRKTSDNSKTNAIDHESASVDNSASERHLHLESVFGIDTVTKSEMCRSESVHSKELVMTSEKKKRKRSTSKGKDQNKFSKMGEEKDQNKFRASDIDGMDHTLQQNVVLPSQGDLVSEVAELNSTGLKAKSPTSEERSGLTKGVNGSMKKCGGYTEFCDVTYRRRKKNYDTGISNSSDSGDTRQPVEDKDNNDASSPCVAEENISGLLGSKFEKNFSGLDVISEQDAGILIERDSVRVLDDEPESSEREVPMNISDLRETSSRNNVLNNSTKVHVSEGICEQKNGGMLVARLDAFKDETSSCKENGSGDISKLDAVKMEISRVESPLSSNHGEVDLAYLDASCKEENVSQMPNTLPERCLVARSKKKLLILDVNGILVDFVPNCRFRPDIRISKKGVFKRPYCDDFLQFCFDRFNVGVWSSRMKFNVDKVVDFLFGEAKHKLLFCWDQSHCTPTGLNTIENKAKPLVLKELRKVWEKVEPDLPFEKGEYDETNTLLLDDSPYKALRNPANTAVFPYPYRFENRHDNSLGPGGDLRTYLEGLCMADNVKEYIGRNPFGQGAITESHRQWDFYSKIVGEDKPAAKL